MILDIIVLAVLTLFAGMGIFRSRINKFLGLVLGLIKGIVLIFVLLALLLPVVDLIDESAAAAIIALLETSTIAKTLYDNNLLLLVIEGLFS